MQISTVTLAQRPDLIGPMWDMPNHWPEYMLHDPVADIYFEQLSTAFPEFQLVAIDESGTLVGKLNSLPFRWDGSDDDLPDRGWDAIQERGFTGRDNGVVPTAVSLLEARVVPEHLGTGLSIELLKAARRNAIGLGFTDMFGPVRPTHKDREPEVPMADYVARLRPDGLPEDPWVRTHVRLGASIVKICPLSMTIPGTLAQWRQWTGLPLTESGPVVIPGGLVPAHVSVEHGHAVYIEPNVWMHHRLTR